MKPETQYIRPQGFDSARYGFTDKMSTQVEQWLARCSAPALRSAVETVFHAELRADRVAAAATVADLGGELPGFVREAIEMATADKPADGRLVQLTGY